MRGKSAVILSLCLIASLAAADTIRLKNGRVIRADAVRQVGTRVEYDIGEDTYAIPRELVERIDTGGAPEVRPRDNRPAERDEAPPIQQKIELTWGEDLRARIIRDGKLDTSALSAMELQGGSAAAAAYQIAALYEHDQGRMEQERAYVERALSFAPTNPPLLQHYAVSLYNLHRYREAADYAEKASRANPESADVFVLLGFAYYNIEKSKLAIDAWKRSLALRPDANLRAKLERVEKELSTEADFVQQDSSHFALRFEGKESPQALRNDILHVLELEYQELAMELGSEPRDSISVLLYTNQAFFDITQAPAWAGALNDGKLRIPIENIETMTPQLERVLRHELAHSFVNFVSRGRAPQWLHEGVAQIIEPKTTQPAGRRLALLFGAKKQIPLGQLESSFVRFSPMEAAVAYAESLAAVEYIKATYGMSDVQRILQRIGEGSSTEAALRSVLHSGYADLEDEIATYLKRTYGTE